MRSLIAKLNGVSFEKDADKVVAVAGKALCMLAVKLDDLIDSEEMRLLPALQKDDVRVARALDPGRRLAKVYRGGLRLHTSAGAIPQPAARMDGGDGVGTFWRSYQLAKCNCRKPAL